MGLCLDTESKASHSSDDAEDQIAMQDWKGGGGDLQILQSPKASAAPQMANIGKVKFQPPNVPVIFILGGPGSGKVTHCDTLMQEKRGVTHINMMDLLQQYAMGNDMQDFSKLPSKTVTEVLMLEIKMSPAAKAYLISGYPRSMRDVVEYTEKIQVLNGVILISWRQAVLQKQIDYGAKLGHVVLSLARMELENFFKNVMPCADYFDQSDMLVTINGERAPSEVYKDFRASVLDILQAQENQEAVLNGVAGIGHGIDEIPGSIVSVETAPKKTMSARNATYITSPPNVIESPIVKTRMNGSVGRKNIIEVETINNSSSTPKVPPIIFVLGGPGSNKSQLCQKVAAINGWSTFSVGRSLRSLAESEPPKPMTENFHIKEAVAGGEMVDKDILEKLLHSNIQQLMNKKGIIIDGYPRDLHQLNDFEAKYNQKPPIILLDCSKLQLGRGRLDDSVSAFRRRLELFREKTLPLLKSLDDGTGTRLKIIDGDPDSASVQREFERILRQFIDKFRENPSFFNGDINSPKFNSLYHQNNVANNSKTYQDGYVEDLDDHYMPGVVPTISNQVSNHMTLANGHIGKGSGNGHIGNGRVSNLRSMLHDAEMNSHM